MYLWKSWRDSNDFWSPHVETEDFPTTVISASGLRPSSVALSDKL